MKRLKIFPKTFLYTLIVMLVIVLLSHLLIYFFMPAVYNVQQKQKLEQDITQLAQQIVDSPQEERLDCIAEFLAKWKANITVQYEDFSYEMNTLGTAVSQAFSQDGKVNATVTTSDNGLKVTLAENPMGGTDFFQAEKVFDSGNGSMKAVVSRQQIEDAVSAVLMILPFTSILCTVISILFAFLYSKMLTRPIRQMSAATQRMQQLEQDASCVEHGQDEIGMLAENVNSLYQTLLRTIHDLEQEIKKVEEADAQKIDFLRSASHELKTPVTAVNVMLENMLLNVGKYKDRDTYLARCKNLVERLSSMIKEILDTSKLELKGEQSQEEIEIADVIEACMEPYRIIAKAKGIHFHADLADGLTVRIPQTVFEKVISNLLSNAVAYTQKGDTIYIYFEGRHLIIENECAVIPPEHLAHIFEAFYRPDYGRNRGTGGNGLGLYIVSSILKSYHLEYEFVPSLKIKGMCFRIKF